MTAISHADLLALGRRSRRAAWVSAAGGALILVALAYGMWQLSVLQDSITAKRLELAAGIARSDSLRREAESLNAQIVALRQQKAELQAGIQSVSRVVAEQKNLPLASALRRLTPLSAVVAPRALSVAVPGLRTSDGRQVFDFSLWIDIPPSRLSEVRSVSYVFNHPTFRQRRQTSGDASSGFRVGYRGWGCLSRIIITLTLRDGVTQPIDFDMCAALGG